jgi:hypothetical protein
MRRYILWTLALALSAGIIFLVLLQSASPLLYSAEYDAFTKRHVNPAVLKPIGQDSADRLLPLMSDLLDTPGTVIVNLEYGDVDIARQDLEEFRQLSQSLDSLVINLDMSSSEVGDFRRMNQKNLQILSELVESTARLEELNTLEIRFRDARDPVSLTSITYEGESLRNQVSQLYTEYRSQEEPLVSVSEKLEIDTTGYEESQDHFEQIVKKIGDEQENRMYTLQTQAPPDRNPFHLTISLTPRETAFHETIRMRGFLSGDEIEGQEIDIFVDTKKTGSVFTDSRGNWEYRYRVGAIAPGRHTSFSVFSNSTFSGIASFNVMRENTFLSLNEPIVTGKGLSCSGRLFSDSGPVDGVSIGLMIDGRRMSSPLTDGTGFFEAFLKPEPGDHQVWAVFSNPDIPLSESQSRAYSVNIPPSLLQEPGFFDRWENVLALVLGILVLAGAIIGAYAYIRRSRPHMPAFLRRPRTAGGDLPDTVATPDAPVRERGEDLHETPGDDVFLAYSKIADSNIREAVHILFSSVRDEIAGMLPLKNPRSCTPREICRRCSNLPLFADLSAFVRLYESVRYGVRIPDEKERQSFIDLARAIHGSLFGGHRE